MMSDKKHVVFDDLFIVRDDEGAVLPIEVHSPMFGKAVSLVPMTYGYMKANGLDMQVPAVNWPVEQKIKMCQNHIRIPDLSTLTVQDAEERMGPMTLNHFVSLVVAYSVPTNLRQGSEMEALTERLRDVLLENVSRKANMSSIDLDTDIPEEEISTD